ncbi:ClpP family protease [Actinoallomurus iriomotensis]|uniref:ATP-dependent Clp protease proteolytic subunit n=1 Tax=Actinoallomurus iriomotensis TaxID=478107 RepID=A0A9W6RTJ9_9ACTN|nr:ATP-dependent Clp protease proteolytic subunit [Actinoallomurus iriomotensis]GLY81465.1 ATP-dependent Clp protease proteolytic subunit 2 [Actinoallomurus iriomotensis]GLY87351.1 ATP-dependent Clp protease proteolytic subunit 2 [Actinoallomurus iriomotensis]
MDFPTYEPRARVTELPDAAVTDQVFQRLLAQRIVFIGSEIDDDLANRVCSQLLLLAAQDGQRDIKLFINSPGGSMDAMFAMYDVMKYLPNDVSTVGLGMAASAGQFLLTAGTPGKRYSLRNTRIMMHQPLGGIRGTASDIRIQAEQSLHLKKRFLELISEHTGRPFEQIEHDADRDRYFTPTEAREYGLIDHVVTSALEAGGVAP